MPLMLQNIPTHVIAGPLGAGKTSLIKHLNTGDVVQGFDMQIGGDDLRTRIAKGQYRSANRSGLRAC